MASLCLPARIDAEKAIQRFNRRRPKNLFGLRPRKIRVAKPGDPATRVPPFIERLWLPAYALCVHTTLRDKENRVWTTVDGLAGYFAFLDDTEDLIPRAFSEDAYPPSVTPEQAETAARRGLLQFIMRQRGQFNKPVIDAVEEIRPFHFPVWVLYYRRLGKRIDIEVIDACTGQLGGPKMRVAVLDALVAARNRRLADEA